MDNKHAITKDNLAVSCLIILATWIALFKSYLAWLRPPFSSVDQLFLVDIKTFVVVKRMITCETTRRILVVTCGDILPSCLLHVRSIDQRVWNSGKAIDATNNPRETRAIAERWSAGAKTQHISQKFDLWTLIKRSKHLQTFSRDIRIWKQLNNILLSLKKYRGYKATKIAFWYNIKYNCLSKDQLNKTEAPDSDEGPCLPYQRLKYYKKLKRSRLI